MRDFVNPMIKSIPPSGIRRFFDIAAEMEDVISLGVGEPDFDTPWNVREEGIYSLERGKTTYTANAGLKQLRDEIQHYTTRKYGMDYEDVYKRQVYRAYTKPALEGEEGEEAAEDETVPEEDIQNWDEIFEEKFGWSYPCLLYTSRCCDLRGMESAWRLARGDHLRQRRILLLRAFGLLRLGVGCGK